MKKLIHAVGTAIKLCILGAVVFMGTTLVLEAIFGGGNDDSKVDVVQTVAAEEPSTKTVTKDESKKTDNTGLVDAPEELLILWAESYKESMGDTAEVTYTIDGNIITFNANVDGAVETVYYASTGNEHYIDVWNQVIESLKTNNAAVIEECKQSGYEVHIIYNVLNDHNPDNCLLTLLDGSVLYDCVNE